MRRSILAVFLAVGCAPESDVAIGDDSWAATSVGHGVAVWTHSAPSPSPTLNVTATSDGGELLYGGYGKRIELDGRRLSNETTTARTAVLAKLDLFGNVEWMRDARSPDGNETSISDAAATSDGGAIVIAVTFSTIDLGCGGVAGRFVIARIDSAGACVWSRRAEAGDFLQFQPRSVAVGPDDRIVVAGIVWDTVTWDDVTLTATGDHAPFVLSLAGDGNGLWGHVLPRTGGVGNPHVGIDGRGITTVAAPYNGTLEDQTADGDDFDLFLGQIDADGVTIRTTSMSGDVDLNFELDVGRATGEIAVAGRFRGTLAIVGAEDLVVTGSGRNTFVVKLTPDAAVKWTKKLTGGAAIFLAGLRVDYIGYVEIVLNAYSTMGNHVKIGSHEWVAAAVNNAFVARLGPNTGSTQWAVRYGDAGSYVLARGLGTTINGRVLLSGEYFGTPDFGDGRLAPPPAGSSVSGFIARIHQ